MVTKLPTPAEPPPEPVPEPRPARRFTDTAAGQTTTLHSGLRIVGQLSGKNSVDLGGALEGDSEIEGLFRVRETARVKGSIEADQVLIEGEVEGEQILARQKVVLGPRAKVRADIDTASLALAEGSFLDGRVHMREGGAGPVSYQERRTEDN
jgi:cytoskeletal protein CcmA (bactofilin family)